VGLEGVVPGEGECLVEGAGVVARGEEEAVVAEEQGAAGGGGLGLRVRSRGGDRRAGVAEIREEGGVEEVAVSEELGGGGLLLRDGEHRRGWPRHDRSHGVDFFEVEKIPSMLNLGSATYLFNKETTAAFQS
jgi:hypothetical protein